MVADEILAVIAVLPGVYGLICWFRRELYARRAARWVKDAYREEWSDLHWLARRNPRAGIEVLVSKGLISGPEVDAFRTRDEYLVKATWLGFLVSAVLLLLVFAWQYVGAALA